MAASKCNKCGIEKPLTSEFFYRRKKCAKDPIKFMQERGRLL